MWVILVLLAGLVVAGAILSTLAGAPRQLKPIIGAGALGVVLVAIFVSSFRFVGENEVGIVIRNVGAPLPAGKIIATGGEKGPQAKILSPGWHPWLWPVIFDLDLVPVVDIPEGSIGVLTARDGRPLPEGQVYAPEWADDVFERMIDAEYFLTDGGGFGGPQTSVLRPRKYRINTRLFNIEIKPLTNVAPATVGVVKSNVGPARADETALVARGERGIWRSPLAPAEYYLNPDAYEVRTVSTATRIVRFAKGSRDGEEREITVRSSDGFTFPVDVRVEFEILPSDAPLVVSTLGGDGEALSDVLNSVVRAAFRNNAEAVKALDYVRQRSQQETQSLAMIGNDMAKVGVTVTGVRIGDVGDAESLGTLLKTQTDREIALQEQLTFQEQQRAAEQRKALTRTQQEAEEERRLATAQYQVQIAEQRKQERIIEAQAQAEAIRVEADAQAQAFQVIAAQIGAGNAALIELLKIVGERGIQITPRVMVNGQSGSGANAETTALIGTMLDSMLSREETPAAPGSR